MTYRRAVASMAVLAALVVLAVYAWAEYNPQLGRFMQRDPIGYPDGMNAYEYERSNPVTSLDPNGLKVLKLVVTNDGGVGDGKYDDQSKKVLDWYFKRVDDALAELDKMTPKIFEMGKKQGRVTFNDKPFLGTLDEYKQLLRKEKDSSHIVQTAGGYAAAKKKAEELVAKADKNYDQIVIEAHGVYDGVDDKGVPTPIGKITFNGELVDAEKARKELMEIGGKAKGKFIMVSCFTVGARTETSGYNKWPGYSTGKAGIDYRATTVNGKVTKKVPIGCVAQFRTLVNLHRRETEPGSRRMAPIED